MSVRQEKQKFDPVLDTEVDIDLVAFCARNLHERLKEGYHTIQRLIFSALDLQGLPVKYRKSICTNARYISMYIVRLLSIIDNVIDECGNKSGEQ